MYIHIYTYIYVYNYVYNCIYIYIYIYINTYIYDRQIVYATHCFKSFDPEYFTDNQTGTIIENNIFPRFHILSFTRLSLHHTFSKLTIKYSSFDRF